MPRKYSETERTDGEQIEEVKIFEFEFPFNNNKFAFLVEYSTSVDESNKILDDDDIISLPDDQSAYSNRTGDSPIENKFVNLNSSSKC